MELQLIIAQLSQVPTMLQTELRVASFYPSHSPILTESLYAVYAPLLALFDGFTGDISVDKWRQVFSITPEYWSVPNLGKT